MLGTSKVKNQAKTIAFIDARTEEYQSLVEGVAEGVEAIVLEGDRDGIETITATLEKYASRHEEIEAVHIISHGSAGSLQLGNRLLNRDTLTEYRSQLGRWSEALTSTAEILLYGCNVAAGMGANFVRQLSEIAGAKIAASVNLTGNAVKGGDWNLGFRTGEIKAPIALVPEVMAAYGGVLATFTVTNVNDSGIGSLRDAIEWAHSGDKIKFDSALGNKTITLTSGQLTVDKDLIIDGGDAANLTISGNNANRAIELVFQNELTVKNLNFVDGKTNEEGVPGSGGAIWTASQTTLKVENSSFSNNATAGYGGGAIWAGHKSNTTVINSKFDNNDATLGQAERGGGAISTNGFAVLTVKDSEFTNNKGINGGAINSVSTAVTVENSQFINNDTTPGALLESSSSSPKGFGGAIYTDGVSASFGGENGTIAIRNSVFDGNKGAGAGGAAFLFIYPGDDVIVEDTTLINNSVINNYIDKAQGGGIRLGTHDNGSNLPSKFAIRNSTFTGNTSEQEGGGLWIDRELDISETDITNSTFSGNRAEGADGTGGYGGAIAAYSPTTIANTTITDNYAGNEAGAIYTNPNPDYTPPIEQTNTIVETNTAGNATGNNQQTNVELISNLQGEAIYGGAESDILNGTDGDDTLSGQGGNDLLNGRDGNDILNGGDGIDTTNGGAGDDIYGADNSNDIVNEAVNAGTDLVRSSATYNLRGNIESLTLTENGDIDGTGNNSDNRITGNDGNNKLNGGNGDDVVVGNGGNDTLIGASGIDILNGGAGDDSLIGHSGSDRFFYDTGSSFSAADVGQDIIADFNKTENDKIVLSKTTFDSLSSSAGLGFSIVAEFEAVTTDAAAATSDAAIAYNTSNGKLFYNPDGSAAGFGGGGLFATLNNKAELVANDFVLQS